MKKNNNYHLISRPMGCIFSQWHTQQFVHDSIEPITSGHSPIKKKNTVFQNYKSFYKFQISDSSDISLFHNVRNHITFLIHTKTK